MSDPDPPPTDAEIEADSRFVSKLLWSATLFGLAAAAWFQFARAMPHGLLDWYRLALGFELSAAFVAGVGVGMLWVSLRVDPERRRWSVSTIKGVFVVAALLLLVPAAVGARLLYVAAIERDSIGIYRGATLLVFPAIVLFAAFPRRRPANAA